LNNLTFLGIIPGSIEIVTHIKRLMSTNNTIPAAVRAPVLEKAPWAIKAKIFKKHVYTLSTKMMCRIAGTFVIIAVIIIFLYSLLYTKINLTDL